MKKIIRVTSSLKIKLQELSDFIHEAKLTCYASGIKPQYDSIKKVKFTEYRRGHWYYRDEYQGSFMAPGYEFVGFSLSVDKNQPVENYLHVWQMFYAGGMTPCYWQNKSVSELTLEILKKALQQVPKKMPFRGPELCSTDIGTYMCQTSGDIICFGGSEGISIRYKILAEILGVPISQEFPPVTFRQYFGGSVIVYDHTKV